MKPLSGYTYGKRLGGGQFGEVFEAVEDLTGERCAIKHIDKAQLLGPIADWKRREAERGMSYWHDLVDWVGGYPFEVAKPEEIFNFWQKRGYTLQRLTTQGGGHGCNEFTFRKANSS